MELKFRIGDIVMTHLEDIGEISHKNDDEDLVWIVKIQYDSRAHYEEYRESELTLICRDN